MDEQNFRRTKNINISGKRFDLMKKEIEALENRLNSKIKWTDIINALIDSGLKKAISKVEEAEKVKNKQSLEKFAKNSPMENIEKHIDFLTNLLKEEKNKQEKLKNN